MDELDELNDRVLRAKGWEKLPLPASPTWQRPTPNGPEAMYVYPLYSWHIAAAWELVEEAKQAGCWVCITTNEVTSEWACSIQVTLGDETTEHYSEGATAPVAICRAWLAWKGLEG